MQNLTSLPESTARILIVRLSAIGDIIQALDSVRALKMAFPKSEVHWVIKREFVDLVQHHPYIDRVWAFDKKDGLRGWLALSLHLKDLQFTHIYDAHNNFRSRLMCFLFWKNRLEKRVLISRRPKDRFKRFLLFFLRKNTYENWPFKGRTSYLVPLKCWNVPTSVRDEVNLAVPNSEQQIGVSSKPYVTLVPSAAWKLKRWPLANWSALIESLPEERFSVLGGPEDTYLFELLKHSNAEVILGKKGLLNSLQIIARSKAVVGNDTGLSHAADQLKVPLLLLVGPTAFGYPASSTSKVVEEDLYCKPCSKDGNTICRNKVEQRCMLNISPQTVASQLKDFL